jgi:peptide/nickel transport system permease protein
MASVTTTDNAANDPAAGSLHDRAVEGDQWRDRRSRALAVFVGKKLLGSAITLVFVVVFNFFLFRVVKSDPVASLFRGRNVPREQLDQLRADFGLDQSIWKQFVLYLRETSRLNFGLSYQSRQPVWEEISSKIWPTVVLVGVSAVLSALFGVIGGIVAAWRRGSAADYSITSSTMVFYSMPDFWLGMLLLVGFAVVLPWFPVGGMVELGTDATGFAAIIDRVHHLALPCLTLTLAYLGEYAIVMRSSMLDVMGEDYLTVARAKGLRDIQVRNRHAVPNSLLPVVTLAAINLGFVLSGAIAVETVFSWPGLGKATSDAVRGPDLPMLQGLFLVFSAAVILFNLLADLLYAVLDPRVRPA